MLGSAFEDSHVADSDSEGRSEKDEVCALCLIPTLALYLRPSDGHECGALEQHYFGLSLSWAVDF